MPQIFKPLVTVSIWLMFIFAWIFSVLGLIIGGFVSGELTGTQPPSMNFLVALALSRALKPIEEIQQQSRSVSMY